MIMSQICLKCTQYNFAPYLLNNKQKDVCQFLDSSVRPTSEFIWLVTRLTLATHICVKMGISLCLSCSVHYWKMPNFQGKTTTFMDSKTEVY